MDHLAHLQHRAAQRPATGHVGARTDAVAGAGGPASPQLDAAPARGVDANEIPQIAHLLAANERYAAARARAGDPRPGRRLAVVTCMDARIDVLAALGLHLGDAHVIRNAGGRVTDDVLRSLALSSHVLGADTVVVMHHTRCGLVDTTDEELQRRTGADIEFLAIDDHAGALRRDVDVLAATPFLAPLRVVAGVLHDIDSGRVDDVVGWERLPG